MNKYMLVTWYWDTMSDYERHHSFETEIRFITSEELDNISKVMKDNFVKQWVTNPETVTEETYKDGDGAIIEFRNVTIKPVKVVESWSYQSEVINGKN